ncbi:Flp pilus assembly complex ATPase component TadA [Enterococcus sp. BWB1-3]|uniref:competence type IV pilus ATPase ComGA n=1 Tax=unclassified Enterococcus TaxID=2608891 RepID=UPI001920A546|nr:MULTISPECIES: competence type IV pilus ATPase ComGA [unclassified Enterococcus]MBL1228199.1 Flp pilus assembly complex ATPase component TadA [Enterococcus sp. BWB1-3]MCB5951936.1 Flp pilus assembly complex ATPase component TadA [Enterococcus sp. BWT-B8]MCB5954132.1 Flp pilus assembly complex ATPase component TadA [Enterococcus sp. CWB-B31]
MDIKDFSKELITWGIRNRAQDLYILPERDRYNILFRTAQSNMRYKQLSKEYGEKLIFHFKFIGQMDVGEKRKAQVGAVSYLVDNQERRLRLSTVGDFKQRESLVIRFLHYFGDSKEHYLLPWQLSKIRTAVKSSGLHLFCGPVGSGKTTLMYKLAKEKRGSHQVICIEDPVEIEEERFLQLQTNIKIDLTYDALIKACLRHRPDILIIGEIRDSLTAKAAIRASLTGHTVFATIHSRGIAGVTERLIELGVKERELAECLQSVIYQRLLPAKIREKKVSALLMEYYFSEKNVTAWNDMLRKVWAYGYIDDITFSNEQRK